MTLSPFFHVLFVLSTNVWLMPTVDAQTLHETQLLAKQDHEAHNSTIMWFKKTTDQHDFNDQYQFGLFLELNKGLPISIKFVKISYAIKY